MSAQRGLPRGGVVCLEGVSARGCLPRGCLPGWSCLSRRRSLPGGGGGGVCVGGGYIHPLHAGIHTWLPLL